ncbi:flavo protein [Terfezia boudieri ATCC MYA-4762]|uniref:Flavo protein n=1 Tax=Terfezia boudieri ATCC MYA-4762 TaxID=1051890 RepID=A0A3N4L8I7_9PEZI|nr:flavo protein [Terfezia boudieri ATCC MYA-4762]
MDPWANNVQFYAPASSTPRTKKHLLLACTGSIIAKKVSDMLTALTPYSPHLNIHVIITPSAIRFLPYTLTHPSPGAAIPTIFPIVSRAWTDADQWIQWTRFGDPLLHIELRQWADLLVIAPLDADFLAKIVSGCVQGVLGGVVRAWDVQKTIMVAPAMDAFTWKHPVMGEQIDVLKNRWDWVEVLEPIPERFQGANTDTDVMREWWEVVGYVIKELGLEGKEQEAVRAFR